MENPETEYSVSRYLHPLTGSMKVPIDYNCKRNGSWKSRKT